MTRLNRQEAKQLGINKCHGSVCAKHPELEGFRWVTGACVQCAREHIQKGRKANPERTKEQQKMYEAKAKLNPINVEKKRMRDAAYRNANKEKIRAMQAEWNAKHPEKVAAHKQTAKGKYKVQKNVDTAMRRASMKQRTPLWLTVDDHWMIEQAYELAQIRAKMFGFEWHVDHIIPLQGKTVSGLHVPWNLQVIPGVENIRKGNRLMRNVS
jgi:hypothetical protein